MQEKIISGQRLGRQSDGLKPVKFSLNFDVKSGFGVELSGIDGIVALIGRDLLKIAIFVYNGPDETFTLAF